MTKPTALYRHFNDAGDLLYVGVSLSAVARLSQHANDAHWASRISRVAIEWLPTRHNAMMAEKDAIRAENPLHNIDRGPIRSPASEIIDALGVKAIAKAVDVTEDAVRQARHKKVLPAAWFNSLETMAGHALPRDCFSFKGAS